MINIFIGTSENKDDLEAEEVLEYSLRKHSSSNLNITFMRNTPDSSNFFGGFNNNTWWTPFSFLRWAIPEYCNFQGRALYMDVDQVNFKDISELFYMDLKGKALAVREGDFRSCVMLMDCEKLKSMLPSVDVLKQYSPDDQTKIIKQLIPFSTTYDKRWNCLDGEDRRSCDIWHLHFTEMTTQPWNPSWAYSTWEKKGHTFTPKTHPRGDLVYIWKHLQKELKSAT